MSLADQGVGRRGGGGGVGEAKLKPEAAPIAPLFFGFDYAGPLLEDLNPPHCQINLLQ